MTFHRSVRHGRLSALLLAACVVDNPEGKPDTYVGHDSVPAESAPPVNSGESGETADSVVVAPDEVCDGVDNDSDGVVDEGFPDNDADTIADCVDDTCVVPLDREESITERTQAQTDGSKSSVSTQMRRCCRSSTARRAR